MSDEDLRLKKKLRHKDQQKNWITKILSEMPKNKGTELTRDLGKIK